MRRTNRFPAAMLLAMILAACVSSAAWAEDGIVGLGLTRGEDGPPSVGGVMPGGPAEKAGVLAGDVILAADGNAISSAEQAVKMLRGPVGTQVKLTIDRNGQRVEVTVTRIAAPGAAANPPRGNNPPPANPLGADPVNPLGGNDAPPAVNPLGTNNAPPANGLPPFLKPGMRLMFREGTSIVHNVTSWLQPGAVPGQYNWKDSTNSGGVGFFTLDIVHATPQYLAAQGRFYLMGDLQQERCTSSGAVGVTGTGEKLEPYWIHPARLAQIPEGREADQQINRVHYSFEGKDYNALSILRQTEKSYSSRMYDLNSGVLLSLSQSQENDPVTVLNNGTLGTARGAKVIEHVRYIGMRERKLPWLSEPAPRWAAKGTQLSYQGNYGASGVAGMGPMMLGMTQNVHFDDGTDGCFTVTVATRRELGTNLPTSDSTTHVCAATALTSGFWMSPTAMRKLQPNQVIDEDPLIKFRNTFAGVQGNVGVFVEQGPLESTQVSYDMQSGVLVSVSSTVQNQIGQQTTQYRLVDQR